MIAGAAGVNPPALVVGIAKPERRAGHVLEPIGALGRGVVIPVRFRGRDAGDWEFAHSDSDADLHAVVRAFVLNRTGYLVWFQTRDIQLDPRSRPADGDARLPLRLRPPGGAIADESPTRRSRSLRAVGAAPR